MAQIRFLPDELNPIAIQRKIAERVKERRLEKNLTQEALSKLSGVSYATLRKYESTGEISLKSLVKIAVAMNATAEFEKLFSEPAYTSMEELLQTKKRVVRKRGTKNG